jgi:hypothetical protein
MFWGHMQKYVNKGISMFIACVGKLLHWKLVLLPRNWQTASAYQHTSVLDYLDGLWLLQHNFSHFCKLISQYQLRFMEISVDYLLQLLISIMDMGGRALLARQPKLDCERGLECALTVIYPIDIILLWIYQRTFKYLKMLKRMGPK